MVRAGTLLSISSVSPIFFPDCACRLASLPGTALGKCNLAHLLQATRVLRLCHPRVHHLRQSETLHFQHVFLAKARARLPLPSTIGRCVALRNGTSLACPPGLVRTSSKQSDPEVLFDPCALCYKCCECLLSDPCSDSVVLGCLAWCTLAGVRQLAQPLSAGGLQARHKP